MWIFFEVRVFGIQCYVWLVPVSMLLWFTIQGCRALCILLVGRQKRGRGWQRNRSAFITWTETEKWSSGTLKSANINTYEHTLTHIHAHEVASFHFSSHLISCTSFILSASLSQSEALLLFSLIPSLHLLFSPFDVVFLSPLTLSPPLSFFLSKMRRGALMLWGLIRMSLKYQALIM